MATAVVPASILKIQTKYSLSDSVVQILVKGHENLKKGEAKLSKENFTKHFSAYTGELMAQKLARALDKDNSGDISVEEYATFFAINIGGSDAEKIATFFRVLDADGSNKLSKPELSEFFAYGLLLSDSTLTLEKAKVTADVVAGELVKLADTNKDGELSLKEVHTACSNSADYKYIFLSFSKGIAQTLQ